MLSYYIFALAPILSLLPSAAAHGILTKVVIDGKSYTGSLPSKTPSDSPIRQVSDVVPVKGADNPSMNCGLNAQVASMVVPANPGSSMEFYWGSPLGSPVSVTLLRLAQCSFANPRHVFSYSGRIIPAQ